MLVEIPSTHEFSILFILAFSKLNCMSPLPSLSCPIQEHYESPLIAVRFENPAMGQLLHIECRAWAANIRYDRMDRIGMAHFELFILDTEMTETYEDSFK